MSKLAKKNSAYPSLIGFPLTKKNESSQRSLQLSGYSQNCVRVWLEPFNLSFFLSSLLSEIWCGNKIKTTEIPIAHRSQQLSTFLLSPFCVFFCAARHKTFLSSLSFFILVTFRFEESRTKGKLKWQKWNSSLT